MGRKPQTKVGIVEAAYAPAGSEVAWLQGIVDSAAPHLSEGLGAAAYIYRAERSAVRIGARVANQLQCPLDDFTLPVETLPPEFIDQTWCSLSFGICSEGWNHHVATLAEMPQSRAVYRAGIRDIININAYDASGFGVCLTAPLPVERRPRPGEAETWTRIATHLASAFRLMRRGRLAASPETATAVLDPQGRLEHASNDETADRVRSTLQKAVLRMERARGSMRHSDPDGAVGMWRTLVNAEFTLLDHFERGGKRYVVAIENPPEEGIGLAALPARERQVLAAAASGRSNKLIAYELGLAHSTVRVLLARAARRLDATSRKELIAIYCALERAGQGGSS